MRALMELRCSKRSQLLFCDVILVLSVRDLWFLALQNLEALQQKSITCVQIWVKATDA